MKIENIHDSWGSYVDLTLDELMSEDRAYWQNLILGRNLIVIRGLDSNTISDEQFFNLSSKFGTVWTKDVYSLPYIVKGYDRTVGHNVTYPVSYFRTDNNGFSDKEMAYHADMSHVNEYSWPGRALWMVKNTTDNSGSTTWLNIELGWELCSSEEKKFYDGYEVVMQDMYRPGNRMEKFPFIKVNPKTGKISPLVNCASSREGGVAWIHHIEHNGVALSYTDTNIVLNDLYKLLESKQDTLYTHHWNTNDMIVYNNWFNVHKRTAVNVDATDGGRLLKRTTFNF
jgi:alpha-ketoglutarate-dependent taurine dioxygenase